MPKGPREPGEISEQEQDGPGQETGVRGQLWPLAGGWGDPTWQSIMVSSSFSSIFFSPVSAHSRASRTGPSGRPPSFFNGASQSGDKGGGCQVENVSLEDSSNCPDWRIMLFARGKRLSHTQPATDSKIQPYTLPTILPYILSKDAQTLGKTQPDPQSHLDTLKGRHGQTLLYNYIHTYM